MRPFSGNRLLSLMIAVMSAGNRKPPEFVVKEEPLEDGISNKSVTACSREGSCNMKVVAFKRPVYLNQSEMLCIKPFPVRFAKIISNDWR